MQNIFAKKINYFIFYFNFQLFILSIQIQHFAIKIGTLKTTTFEDAEGHIKVVKNFFFWLEFIGVLIFQLFKGFQMF